MREMSSGAMLSSMFASCKSARDEVERSLWRCEGWLSASTASVAAQRYRSAAMEPSSNEMERNSNKRAMKLSKTVTTIDG